MFIESPGRPGGNMVGVYLGMFTRGAPLSLYCVPKIGALWLDYVLVFPPSGVAIR